VIRVILVDDEPTIRRALQMHLALEPDLVIVGEAGSGQEAIEMARVLEPDVVVMDIAMPGLDGIATTASLREVVPKAAVVVLTLHGDGNTRARAREAGAMALVEKQGGLEILLEAIHAAVQQQSGCQEGRRGCTSLRAVQ
jgi:DNA-binding NarL/FixJ family response regulator